MKIRMVENARPNSYLLAMYDRREIPKSVVFELGRQARLGHGGNFEFERS